MDIDRIDPQVIIILMIMVVGGIRWVLEQIKASKGGIDSDQRADEDLDDLYEEARREIFERQTTVEEAPPEVRTPQPPPLVAQRQEVMVYPEPKATPPPPPLPKWDRKVTRQKLSAAEQKALARVQRQQAERRPTRRTPSSGSRIRRLLSSPASARDAIILGEILGPPKGEQR